MDRNATIGFVLIFVLLMIWMYMNSPSPTQVKEQAKQGVVKKDTAKPVEVKPKVEVKEQKAGAAEGGYGVFFSSRVKGPNQLVTIQTDLFTAQISSKGALITEWKLKKYKTWDGNPVQLVSYEKTGDYSLLFTTSDGKLVDTRDLYYDADTPGGTITLSGQDSVALTYILPASNGGRIVKRFVFRNGKCFTGTRSFSGLNITPNSYA